MRVDFFIAGVQKGGTTALDRMLRKHPGVKMARVKEPHFFDDEEVDWNAPDYAAYHELFDVVPGESVIVGEATPISSFWPNTLQRIRDYNSHARIVLCLRHPSFRAHSHWRKERMRKMEDLPFSDAIRHTGRSRVAAGPEGARVFAYVERGFYSIQIQRIQHLFPSTQVLYIRTDRLWRDTADVLDRICSFLQLSPHPDPPISFYDVAHDTRALGGMGAEDRLYLDDLFADDIRQTARLTNLDLNDWLDPAYEEPMK